MAQLKRQYEAELARAARKRIARTEVEFCIEAMSHAFSMFRASEEWQRIGEVGRWFTAWMDVWILIGCDAALIEREARGLSCLDLPVLGPGMTKHYFMDLQDEVVARCKTDEPPRQIAYMFRR